MAKANPEKKRKPYSERSDIEKLESNWRKVGGFISREEWSAAITRAATAAEIATNIAIRHELQEQRGLEENFVDHLLIWANGLAGKLEKLLRPLHTTEKKKKVFTSLKKRAEKINSHRNQVAHSGNFMNKSEATDIVKSSEEFIKQIIAPYHPDFSLPEMD